MTNQAAYYSAGGVDSYDLGPANSPIGSESGGFV